MPKSRSRFNLSLSSKLLEQVNLLAEEKEVSTNQIIQEAVRAYLLIRGFQKEDSKLLLENNQGKMVELVLI